MCHGPRISALAAAVLINSTAMGNRGRLIAPGGLRDELAEMAEEQLRAELEYWRELELISGQRQHFKPGLTDETAYQDDEVAA